MIRLLNKNFYLEIINRQKEAILKMMFNHKAINIFIILCMFFGMTNTVDAQWNKVARKTNKTWKQARKGLNKSVKSTNIDDIGKMEELVSDGLSIAENGFGNLEDFSKDLMDDALSELQDLTDELAEAVIDEVVSDISDFMIQTSTVLNDVYMNNSDKVANLATALAGIAVGGSVSAAEDAFNELKSASTDLQNLINLADDNGYGSILLALEVAGGTFGGGASYTVGIAIKISPYNPYSIGFMSFAGSLGYQGGGIGSSIAMGFNVYEPNGIPGPSLFGSMEIPIGLTSAAATVNISVPKITGSFPNYNLQEPEFLSFMITASMFADGGFVIGSDFTAKIAGSSVEFGEDTDRPNRIIGDENNNNINGTSEDDIIWGEGGNDNIFGGDGDDTIEGGDGDDELDGGEGHDELDGGDGDDILRPGDGRGIMRGGGGYDEVWLPGKKKNYSINKNGDYWVAKRNSGSDKQYLYDCELVRFKDGNGGSKELD